MKDQEKLTSIDFWVDNKHEHIFSRHDGHGIDEFIRKYIPASKNGSCLEIGSFPGPFLATFGDLGYVLNGVDFHPDNKDKVPAWLNSLNFSTGSFDTQDFFEYNTPERFDVVASFGFIEHFSNYEEIILKHAGLVKKNGYLLITTPNFKGWLQHFLHKTWDRTNLSYHNLQSMQPEKWAALLERSGFQV
ncbi:MAG: class I SAM-dependent methyltransferase, partial [Ferruginibacter sp.]